MEIKQTWSTLPPSAVENLPGPVEPPRAPKTGREDLQKKLCKSQAGSLEYDITETIKWTNCDIVDKVIT